MESYKGYYGTRAEYIEHLKERIKFWAKAFAEEPRKRVAMQTRLENAENALAAEGIDWDEIEALEIEGMKTATMADQSKEGYIMAQYASNFTEFTDKAVTALTKALNNTEMGQKLMDDLLKQSLEKNPALTPEEWTKIKQDFLTFCFFTAVQGCPEAMHELAGHVYNELNGGNEND